MSRSGVETHVLGFRVGPPRTGSRILGRVGGGGVGRGWGGEVFEQGLVTGAGKGHHWPLLGPQVVCSHLEQCKLFFSFCCVHIFLYLIKYSYKSSFKVLSDNFNIWVISGLPLFISWTLRMICWGDSEFCFSPKNVDFLVYFCRQFNLMRLKV